MALLPTEQEIIGAEVTNAQQKTRFAAMRQFIQDLLGTDSSNKAAARASLGVGIGPRVSGLRGNVNTATPLTKFDLSADMVMLRDANGGTVTRYNTGTMTCDLGLAGSAANGRDQAGAFPANSWINLFLIWNGATLATIASTKAHTAGPTLPEGYTHWCYATTLRWNASSNITECWVSGSYVHAPTTLINGAAVNNTQTTLSLASAAPPNSLSVQYQVEGELTASTSANVATLSLRVVGGKYGSAMRVHSGAAGGTGVNSLAPRLPYTGSSCYYLWQEENSNTVARAIRIMSLGYTLPNGDA